MTESSRRHFLTTVTAGLTSLASPLAFAQAWPSKPIKLVVAFPPGGLSDNMARLLAPLLTKELGQTIVIDNKSGFGGNLGAAEVSRAPADGYTLLMASPPLTISPALRPGTMGYKPEQIVPVSIYGFVPNVLIVHPDSGINSVAELLARAKASPGKMNYASNGFGTSLQLSAELFKATSKTFITHIPYRGAAAAVTALLGREVDMAFENLPSVLGQIQGGRVKALAVTSKTRSKALPEVPTLAEQGMPNYDVSSYFGIAAPAGMPADVAARLEAAIEKATRDASIVAVMEKAGASVKFLSSKDSASFMAADSAVWKQVVATAGIKVE